MTYLRIFVKRRIDLSPRFLFEHSTEATARLTRRYAAHVCFPASLTHRWSKLDLGLNLISDSQKPTPRPPK